MASAESPPATVVENSIQEAPSLPDVPAHEPQPTRSTLPTSSPTTTSDAGERTPEINRTTSLFGPFPPAKEGSHIDQQPGIATGPTQTSGAPPAISTDQIEPPKENRPSATQPSMPALNFDPTAGEPLFSTAANKPTSPKQAAMPALTREKTAPAIGPATDKPTPVPKESEIEGPMLFITLLLTSTGTRHPYKLDEKYLKKRNVVVEGNNPVNISLYKLKELILRDWRDEWEAKPSSPESIRLISMGKMLNDKSRLSDSGFKNGVTPHIIHMTIKPQEIVDEEDARLKSGGRDRDGNERSPGCRCVIQ